MLLDLSPDQEFFRETTAKFLADLVPVDELRRLRDDPDGFDRNYWKRGAELGWTSLLVAEANGGGSVSGRGVVDLAVIAHEIGWAAAPGPFTTTNVVAAALSDTDAAPGRARRPDRRHDDRVVVPDRGAAQRRPGRRRPGGPGRRRRAGAVGREASGRVGERRRPPPRRRPHRRRADPGARPDGRRRRDGRADGHGRPHPPLLARAVRRRARAGERGGRRGRRGGRPGRAAAAAGAGDAERRVGRRDAARVRHDRRVGVRPLHVRPAALLVPGAQAPLRRHEVVARGQPCPRRRGRRRRPGPRRRTPPSWPARPRRSSATTASSWCRTACSSTAASASRTSTTSTSSCAGSPSTGRCSARPPSTGCGSPTTSRTARRA